MRRYDFIVVGGGAAGFAAAVRLSELTQGEGSIAMVNSGKIGGTCVNVGCVPSKYLIEAAKQYYESRHSRFDGVDVMGASLDFGRLMDGLRRLVDSMRSEKYEKVLDHYNIELVRGKASFKSSETLMVEDGGRVEEIAGRIFLVATGSAPLIPKIEGLDSIPYLTTDNIWGLRELPDSLLVIGGGAIGLELGQAFSRLGSKVTIVEALDRVLPVAEPEVSEILGDVLRKEGINILTKSRVSRLRRKGEAVEAEILSHKGSERLTFDKVLIAVGRRPNTSSLNLERIGVELDKRGFIKVDEFMRTSNSRVYAAGDVVSKKLMLETLSSREGVVAAENMAGRKATIDYSSVPVVTFTEPQVAWVGLTEEEVVERYHACSCRVVRFTDVPKALITGYTDGVIKIVIEPGSHRVLGVHALSHHAAEYIVAAAHLIRAGQTIEDLLDTIHVFPTFAEAMKLAAIAFKRPLKAMPCCME